MARTKSAAAPKAAPPPITDYQQIWVHHRGVELNGKPVQVGYIWALKTNAAQLIADGHAVNPYTTFPPYITDKPTPPPPVTVAITAISAANPAVATMSAADVTKIVNAAASQLTISGATGTDAATVNGLHACAVQSTTEVALTDLDNSLPLTFGGYPLAGTLPA